MLEIINFQYQKLVQIEIIDDLIKMKFSIIIGVKIQYNVYCLARY